MIAKSFLALAMTGLSAVQGLVLENYPVVPEGWKKLDDKVHPWHLMRLSIALREPEIIQLKERVKTREFYAPSAKWHLTREEAYDLRTPDKEDVDNVMDWLAWKGLAIPTLDKSWIHVLTTVGEAEKLLNMKLEYWQYGDNKRVLRTQKYSIPDDIADTIHFIHPIANFMRHKKELPQLAPRSPDSIGRRAGVPCYTAVTPDCLRELYHLPADNANATSNIRMGITGFLEQFANEDDIYTFLNATEGAKKNHTKPYSFSVEEINGGENSQDIAKSGAEAALDLEYGIPLAYPAEVIYYAVGGRGPQLNETNGKLIADEYASNEPFLEFLNHLLDKPDEELPQVLSVSYADVETTVPRPYAEHVCDLFGLLVNRGVTVVAGSGDNGARGSNDSKCRTLDGTDKDVTNAMFPATCPWVLAVGAVTNYPIPPQGATFSGGGFSQYFPREPWQDTAVDGYVKALDGHLNGFYNASMRAVPDISAVGTNFVVRYAGKGGALQGTSASTPVIASMIALINDARAKKGKEPLGWINDLLYTEKVQSVLQDITTGMSQSCDFKDIGAPGGWPAAKGWDGITGLGVPSDFRKFMEVLVDA